MDDYRITTAYDLTTGEIRQRVDYQDREFPSIRKAFLERVLQTKDEQVRQALIALGWTPPQE